jgi:hypothetical protein
MIEELTGYDFPVAVTSGHEEVARGIAERIQRARTWMSGLFRLEPAIRVEVLGPEDWKDRAEVQVYGLPHINDAGTIPPSHQGVTGLDLMNPEDPPAYVWYELRLQVMAIGTWQTGGRRALRELYDVCLKAGKEDKPVALDELPREVAAVVAAWPNLGR